MVFLEIEEGRADVGLGVGGIRWWSCPEDIVVVGKVGEEDSEEEADRWEDGVRGWVVAVQWLDRTHVL